MIKAISEVHKSDSEIGTKMDPVDKENKNEIKVAAMLQLQSHRNLNPFILDKLQKQLRTKTRLL